eukprot:Skav213932  [mRNA]  locus=scaffold2679:104306:104782:- [translate_table: standard]
MLFADGFCSRPMDVHTRHATYAIMYLTCSHRIGPVEWLLDHCYAVAAVAIATGKQTINRAELLAIVVAFEAANIPLATDSGYAVKAVALVKGARDVGYLRARLNFDFLRRLHVLAWDRGFTLEVIKVQARQELAIDDWHLALLRQGNAIADHVAGEAN